MKLTDNKRYYPRGKLSKNDEDATAIYISIEGGNTVRIDFGKDLSWIGFDKSTAISLAHFLMDTANKTKEH